MTYDSGCNLSLQKEASKLYNKRYLHPPQWCSGLGIYIYAVGSMDVAFLLRDGQLGTYSIVAAWAPDLPSVCDGLSVLLSGVGLSKELGAKLWLDYNSADSTLFMPDNNQVPVTIGPDKAKECWDALHQNNMSKCIGGKLVKREDGKVLKPDGRSQVGKNISRSTSYKEYSISF